MTQSPIFVVTGSRDGTQWREFVDSVLDRDMELFGLPKLLVHGACRGVDTLCAEWADRLGVPTLPFPAEEYGPWPMCGPIRNEAMVKYARGLFDAGESVHFIAFPGGKGTANCTKHAKKAGLRISQWTLGARGNITERGIPARKSA